MLARGRYKIVASFNDATKREVYCVWKDNYLLRSAHSTRHEAKIAMTKYIAADKNKMAKWTMKA